MIKEKYVPGFYKKPAFDNWFWMVAFVDRYIARMQPGDMATVLDMLEEATNASGALEYAEEAQGIVDELIYNEAIELEYCGMQGGLKVYRLSQRPVDENE